MEKQCTKCHSKEILIKHPVRKWPNGNPEEFYVCSNKKCSYHRFSISEEEISQAILSAEEAKVREAAQIVRSHLLMSWATEEDVYEEIETIAKKIDSLSLPDQEQLSNSKTE